MKAILATCMLILAVTGALSLFGQAPMPPQHIEIPKAPGEETTVYFWSLPADLTSFDGITVESATQIQGPYSDEAFGIAKTDKWVKFPAPALPTFYRFYWYKNAPSGKIKSPSSNPVAVFIVLNGLPVATGQ